MFGLKTLLHPVYHERQPYVRLNELSDFISPEDYGALVSKTYSRDSGDTKFCGTLYVKVSLLIKLLKTERVVKPIQKESQGLLELKLIVRSHNFALRLKPKLASSIIEYYPKDYTIYLDRLVLNEDQSTTWKLTRTVQISNRFGDDAIYSTNDFGELSGIYEDNDIYANHEFNDYVYLGICARLSLD